MSPLPDARKKSGEADSKPGDFSAMQWEDIDVVPAHPPHVRADALRAAGENLFAAKNAPAEQRPRWGMAPAALIVGGILAGGGGYYYLATTTPLNGHDNAATHNETRRNTPHSDAGGAAGHLVGSAGGKIAGDLPVGDKELQRDFSVKQGIVHDASSPSAPAVVAASSVPVLVALSSGAAPPVAAVDTPVIAASSAKKYTVRKKARGTADVAREKVLSIRHEQESGAVDDLLAGAYKSYKNGDYATANQRYREALSHAPLNRDALLGLAVIAQQQEQDDTALHYYRQVLALDPRDPVAHAGLVSFGRGDPATKESRLKQLISQQPDSAVLYFALGNQYADQSRWSDAQQAYFNALAMESGNAFFAFNLAVSLDHLGQRGAAAKYYQQAIQFDPSGHAGFSRAQAQQRLDELAASDQ